MKKFFVLLALFLSFGLTPGDIVGAPAPPQVLINHSTKQCAWFSAGDEFYVVEKPTGWVSAGWRHESIEKACPETYKIVELTNLKGKETKWAKKWKQDFERHSQANKPVNLIRKQGWSCSAH